MANHMHLVTGAVAGVVTALLIAVAVVLFWPGVTPTPPPKPTALVLPSDTPTPLPVVTPTPVPSVQIVGPTHSIAPFGDQ